MGTNAVAKHHIMPLHSSTSFSSKTAVFGALPLGVLNLALTDCRVNIGLVSDSTWGASALGGEGAMVQSKLASFNTNQTKKSHGSL